MPVRWKGSCLRNTTRSLGSRKRDWLRWPFARLDTAPQQTPTRLFPKFASPKKRSFFTSDQAELNENDRAQGEEPACSSGERELESRGTNLPAGARALATTPSPTRKRPGGLVPRATGDPRMASKPAQVNDASHLKRT